MGLPHHRTKIVCTIGPASAKRETLQAMMQAGMNVCRLNFAHGDFDSHAANIRLIRETAEAIGHRISIYADLPGPKIRLGVIAGGKCTLDKGAGVTLTTAEVEGTTARLPVHFPELPQSVGPGDPIFLNDGFLQLTVEAVRAENVACRVGVGGPLLSHKGVNIPVKELPIKAFTPHDHEILKFAMGQGVDVVSQSFVQKADDLHELREAARAGGGNPLVFGKIERALAVENIDTILPAADGIMVARGDLGVETPIERIAITQKRLIRHAHRAGKLVITATQMLESMVGNPRPTRAEATDVANAILDGTDCVMLSEESAIGSYPVEAVKMLAAIASATEAVRPRAEGRPAGPARPAIPARRRGDRQDRAGHRRECGDGGQSSADPRHRDADPHWPATAFRCRLPAALLGYRLQSRQRCLPGTQPVRRSVCGRSRR